MPLSQALSLEILPLLIDATVKIYHAILSLLWYSVTQIMSGLLKKNQSICIFLSISVQDILLGPGFVLGHPS